jgi:hypothetical protein
MFTKLDLIERIIASDNKELLEKVGELMSQEASVTTLLSKNDLEELDKRWRAYKAGKGRSYTREEFVVLMDRPRFKI